MKIQVHSQLLLLMNTLEMSSSTKLRSLLRRSIFISLALLLSATILLPPCAFGKENPITAIALFDGPSGPAYAQITGITLNGKSEIRVCDGVSRMTKTVYDSL